MAERYAGFHRRSIEQPRRVLGRAGAADRLAQAVRARARLQPPAVRALVRRRADQPLPQRGRPPPRRRAADQPALVWISTEVDQQKTLHLRELHAEVNRFAAVLQALGVGQGDRVLIYMPMIAGGGVRDAGLRAHRRDPLGGVRRLCRREPGRAHRRRAAEGDGHRRCRHRAWARSIPYKPLLDEAIRLSQLTAAARAAGRTAASSRACDDDRRARSSTMPRCASST